MAKRKFRKLTNSARTAWWDGERKDWSYKRRDLPREAEYVAIPAKAFEAIELTFLRYEEALVEIASGDGFDAQFAQGALDGEEAE